MPGNVESLYGAALNPEPVYTICYIRRGEEILLLNRQKPPWMGSWNGVGGKIEPGEAPLECVLREVREETGISLREAAWPAGKRAGGKGQPMGEACAEAGKWTVRCKGTVTWHMDGKPSGGMHLFLAEVPADFEYEAPRGVPEGILDWKTVSWILHPENSGVAHNLPYYLPKLLQETGSFEHRCLFEGGRLVDVVSLG